MPWQLAAHLVESQAPGILGASGWEEPWGTWEDLHTLLDFQNSFVIFSSNITYPCVLRVLNMTFLPPGRSHRPDPGDQYHRPQRPQAHWPQRHHTHRGKTSRPHGRWPSRSQGACRPTWTNVELCTEKMDMRSMSSPSSPEPSMCIKSMKSIVLMGENVGQAAEGICTKGNAAVEGFWLNTCKLETYLDKPFQAHPTFSHALLVSSSPTFHHLLLRHHRDSRGVSNSMREQESMKAKPKHQ